MLRALQSFHAGDRLVRALEEVHDHDDVVAGREHLFEQLGDESTSKSTRRRSSGKSADAEAGA